MPLEGLAWRLGAAGGLVAGLSGLSAPSGWLLVALPVALLVVLIKPKLALLVIPALIVLALLKPRLGRR